MEAQLQADGSGVGTESAGEGAPAAATAELAREAAALSARASQIHEVRRHPAIALPPRVRSCRCAPPPLTNTNLIACRQLVNSARTSEVEDGSTC